MEKSGAHAPELHRSYRWYHDGRLDIPLNWHVLLANFLLAFQFGICISQFFYALILFYCDDKKRRQNTVSTHNGNRLTTNGNGKVFLPSWRQGGKGYLFTGFRVSCFSRWGFCLSTYSTIYLALSFCTGDFSWFMTRSSVWDGFMDS